jgi:hypothetical protein
LGAAGEPVEKLLVLDDLADEPGFVWYENATTPKRLSAEGLTPEVLQAGRSKLRLFAGDFDGNGKDSLLFADCRYAQTVWYRGTLDTVNSRIVFTALSGRADFIAAGYNGLYRASTNELVAVADNAGALTFRRYRFAGGMIARADYGVTLSGAAFRGEWLSDGRAVLRTGGQLRLLDISGAAARYESYSPAVIQQQRDDLHKKVYAFNWIQGDYNGDGKTDLGFFT